MILLILGVRWLVGPWSMAPDWAGRAGEVDPYNLDGAFTLGGTWFGMLAGFVILTEKKGRFMAGKGGWRRVVRFVVGLIGVLILYLGLGEVFPDRADVLSYSLRFVRYTLIGLWVSWIAPVLFAALALLQFESQARPE